MSKLLKVKNPYTNRWVMEGTQRWRKLLNEGIIDKEGKVLIGEKPEPKQEPRQEYTREYYEKKEKGGPPEEPKPPQNKKKRLKEILNTIEKEGLEKEYIKMCLKAGDSDSDSDSDYF